MRIEPFLADVAREALSATLGVEGDPGLRPTQDPLHGDFQVNAAMALAKKLGKKPRELAQPIADWLAQRDEIASAVIAGPGFVNLRLRDEWIGRILGEALADKHRVGVPRVERASRIVVDFSGPNIAKQMHVGHLRSTIIGDSIVRLLRFVGHEVVGDNHLGDWGTQFGLLIVGMRTWGSEHALGEQPIEELERVYRLASAQAKTDEAFAESARRELARLQAGDPENRALWERFVAATRVALDRVYARLDVHFDEWLGESAYDAMLPGVVSRLLDARIAREDAGAVCVFFSDHASAPEDLRKLEAPLIVRKKDGAYLYATTDIATLVYRRERFQAERCIYVVDARQELHFRQLFAASDLLGLGMRLEHVGFGTVLGGDGKPIKTRDGTAITLESLLTEAERRAQARIKEEGLDVPPAELDAVARAVGVGAVKYADLRQNRLSDYQFDWDKLISFKGNAGPYLQYAYARVQSIFRKGGVDAAAVSGPIAIAQAEEAALARELLKFPDVVHAAAESCLPHLVCDHLYRVAKTFSSFYEACPVLKAEPATQRSRLALATLTGRQLRTGLGLLGIATVERM